MRLNVRSLTLLELIIVVVIVAVIASFAIPGYMGVRQRAEGRGSSTLLKLIHAAEKVRHLESGLYIACAGYGVCNPALDLDLPDDGWTYGVACVGGCANNFSATAAKGGCTYTMTKTSQKPTPAGCIYIP